MNTNTGLYDPRFEHDACGVGFVADGRGQASHAIVESALEALCRLQHRGAVAADHRSGDGAGLLLPLPQAFFREDAAQHGMALADADPIGIVAAFTDGRPGEDGDHERQTARSLIEAACSGERLRVVGWRAVPLDVSALGEQAQRTMPCIEQAVITSSSVASADELERRCFRARKRAEAAAADWGVRLYVASISFKTVVYKAMCAADQLAPFYRDLSEPGFSAAFAIFHQRYSTNTAPSWERAQPFRFLCHNGEINTIQGNVNWMRAREGRLGAEDLAPEELLSPVIGEAGSDSAMLDNALELLVRGGRDIRHALTMLVPEAWEQFDVDAALRDFYRYHASLMEPWDGPAALVFTDGERVGAALDRNDLRPLRYAVCEDGLIACASEAGAVELAGHGLVRRPKLGPGEMIAVDPAWGGLEENAAIKARLACQAPYGRWVEAQVRSGDPGLASTDVPGDLLVRQAAFGYTKEEFTFVLRPMASQAKEPVFSMGDDTPSAVLAERPRLLYNYFKQRFAQVTNPAIDHLRERHVMSLRTCLGSVPPLLARRPSETTVLEFDTFLLFPSGLASLREPDGPFKTIDLDATFDVADGPRAIATRTAMRSWNESFCR